MRFPLHICMAVLLLSLAEVNSQNAAPYFTDIHMHGAIVPYNSKNHDLGLWEVIPHSCSDNKTVLKNSKDIPKYSQCNFESFIKGGVKLAYISLTPIEYEMRHPRFIKKTEKMVPVLSCVTGCRVNHDFFENEFIDYFDDLRSNIQYIIDEQRKAHPINNELFSFEIIKNKHQLKSTFKNPYKIGIMLSIEGAHALGHSYSKSKPFDSPEYAKFVLENVERLKGVRPFYDNSNQYLDYPVWFITINHFMWNGLSGHARTFSNKQNLIFNQSKMMNTGFTDLGKQVVEKLLDKSQGRRILIDVKHMSVASRKWYYNYVEQQRAKGDNIPILASHTGITGKSWDDEKFIQKDKPRKNKESYTDQWTIGLADEDVRHIFASKGIIGIMLDKYKLVGNLAKNEIENAPMHSEEKKQLYIQAIAANILEIVDAIRTKEAWNIISIGSDFDGVINSMEHYETYEDFPKLEQDLIHFFDQPTAVWDLFSKEQIEYYKFGMTGEEIVQKIMGKNATEFSFRIIDQHIDAYTVQKSN